MLERFLIELDRAIKVITVPAQTSRDISLSSHPLNTSQATVSLDQKEKERSISLLRVNHSGEICAAALYHGQALTEKSPFIQQSLRQSALEEKDHLAWCEERLQQLGGHTSILNSLWYTGSFFIGAVVGKLGTAWNLGFLMETEKQVVEHLDNHLMHLPEKDLMSRKILEQMKQDESEHAIHAHDLGGKELPQTVKRLMRSASKLMTTTSFYV